MTIRALYSSVHWTARVLGVALFLLFAAFEFGEGFPPVSAESAALGLALAGILLALWFEGVGGIVILLGAAWFYWLNYAASGRLPGGWVFPLLWVAGVLFLLSAALRCGARSTATP